MVVIGITGPTGAGKTTALEVIRRRGGVVLDGDAVYHRLLREDAGLRRDLENRFGDLTGADGGIDRKKLGAQVFADPAALADLNAIAYPRIVAAVEGEIARARSAGYQLAAIDAVGLVESGLIRLCGATLAVTAPAAVRVKRIMTREGISEDYAWARVKAQPEDGFYARHCTVLLVNDCASPEEFQLRVEQALDQLMNEKGGHFHES